MSDSQISHSVPAPSVTGRGEGSDANGDGVRTLRRALKLAYPYLRDAAEPHVGYGGFHGGDPRNFTPDPECSTEAERAAHRAACERWDRIQAGGEQPTPEPDTHSLYAAEGMTLHVARAGYGLGTYVIHDEKAERALRAVAAALDSLPRTEPSHTASEPIVGDERPATSRCAKSVSVPGPDSGRTP